MKFNITISQEDDGMFIVECPSILGSVGKGRTDQEAEKNIREVIRECLEGRAQGECY